MKTKIFSLICVILMVNSAFSVTVKNKNKSQMKAFNPKWVSGSHLYGGNNLKDINNGADDTFLIHKTDNTAVIINSAGAAVKNIPACDNKIVYKDVNQVWCLTSVGTVYKLVNNAWQYKYAGPYRDISVDLAFDGLLFFCNLHGYGISYIWTNSGAAGNYPGACYRIKATNHRAGIFIVGTNNRLYSWYEAGHRWLDYGGWISDVAHDKDLGYAAVIGGSHVLYTNDFTTGYRGYTGAVKRITFGPENRLYGIGLDNRLYEFQTQRITYSGFQSPLYKGFTESSGGIRQFSFKNYNDNGAGYGFWSQTSNGYIECENYGDIKKARYDALTTCKWQVIPVAPDYFCIKNYHVQKFLKVHHGHFKVWDTVCWRPNQWNLYQ